MGGFVFPDFTSQISQPPKSIIGDIPIDVPLEQIHTDRLEVTEHPVQQGAAITDHSYKRPAELVLRCGWSNSSPLANSGGFDSAFFSTGSTPSSEYIDGIYSKLLALQESRQLFPITTLGRQYQNMLMTLLERTVDEHTHQALMIEAQFRQIIIVTTTTSSLPAMSSQATPQSTAEVQNVGTKTTQAGAPAPGGSSPPSGWGSSLISR